MSFNPADLLAAFFSNDNQTRKQAEEHMNYLAANSPNDSMDMYLGALDLENNQLSELAAVSIKKYHLQTTDVFKLVSPDRFEILAKKALTLLESDRSINSCKRCAEILCLLYQNDDKKYECLVTEVFNMHESKSINVRIGIVHFIELICDYCFNEKHLKAMSDILLGIFEKYLVQEDTRLKCATVKAMASFLTVLEDESFIQSFVGILPIFVQTLIEAVKTEEESGISILQSISDLIESQSDLMSNIIEDLLNVVNQIFKNRSFSEALRSQALEVVHKLGAFCDVALRNSNAFKNDTLPALIEVISEIDQIGIDEWMKDMDDANISKNDPAHVAIELLPQLCESLKAKFMLSNLLPFIKQCFNTDKWNAHYAAVMSIGVLAEGAAKHFRHDLDGIMSLMLPGFESTDPRVNYAAITSIALLCNEFSPDIQRKYGDVIMQNLLKAMNNDNVPKCQKQAISSVVNFGSKISEDDKDADILAKYSDLLVDSCIHLFQTALAKKDTIMLEEVLNGVSMISAAANEKFAKHYDIFMPGMKLLLQNIPSEDETQVRLRLVAIETMSFLIGTIKDEERFINECEQIMDDFIKLQSTLDMDDAQHGPIMDFYCQVSAYMRENFVKYMEYIYPKVLEFLKMKVQVFHINDEKDTKFAIKGNLKTELMNIDNFTLDTATITNKLAACNSVFCFSKNLGKQFFPYISQTLPVLVDFFSDKMSLTAQQAIKSIKNMAFACQEESHVVEIINLSFVPLITTLKERIKVEDNKKIYFILKQMNKTLRYITTPSIDPNLTTALVEVIGEAVGMAENQKNEIMNQFKKRKQMDEQKRQDIEEQYEEFNDIFQSKSIQLSKIKVAMELSTNLMKVYQEKIENLIANAIAPKFYSLMQSKNAINTEILYTICFFDSFMEYCSMDIFMKASNEVAQYLLEHTKSKDPSTVQSSVYGLGVFAKRMDKQTFSNIKSTVLDILSKVIVNSNMNMDDDNQAELFDTSVGALGKIALYQGTNGDKFSEDILTKFLQFLPLKHDYEEDQAVHKMLLEEILNKNEFLMNCSQEVQNSLGQSVKSIQISDASNPENEILCDKGRQLIGMILGNQANIIV